MNEENSSHHDDEVVDLMSPTASVNVLRCAANLWMKRQKCDDLALWNLFDVAPALVSCLWTPEPRLVLEVTQITWEGLIENMYLMKKTAEK